MDQQGPTHKGGTSNGTDEVYTRSDKQFSEITCNDDAAGHDSQVTFSATAGTTYYFMIGSYHDTPGGNLVFNVADTTML